MFTINRSNANELDNKFLNQLEDKFRELEEKIKSLEEK